MDIPFLNQTVTLTKAKYSPAEGEDVEIPLSIFGTKAADKGQSFTGVKKDKLGRERCYNAGKQIKCPENNRLVPKGGSEKVELDREPETKPRELQNTAKVNYATLLDGLHDSKLPEETATKFKSAVHQVLLNIPEKAQQRIQRNLAGSAFYESSEALTNANWDTMEKEIRGKGTNWLLKVLNKVLGIEALENEQWAIQKAKFMYEQLAVGSYDRRRKMLRLDGADGAYPLGLGKDYSLQRTSDIYAHELTHAIDGPQNELSKSDEWKEAYQMEIAGGKLTDYATTSVEEGLAEFGRAVYSGRFTEHELTKAFPRCSQFFKDKDLWGTGFAKEPEYQPGSKVKGLTWQTKDAGGPCGPGETSAKTGCVPASGDTKTPLKKEKLKTPKVGPSPFSFRSGSQAARITEAVLEGPATVEEVAGRTGATVRRVKEHLQFLQRQGLLEKAGDKYQVKKEVPTAQPAAQPAGKPEKPKELPKLGEQNQWQKEGYEAAKRGDYANPYPKGSVESSEWATGAIAYDQEKKPEKKEQPKQEPAKDEKMSLVGKPCGPGQTAAGTGCMPQGEKITIPTEAPYQPTKTDAQLKDLGFAWMVRVGMAGFGADRRKLNIPIGDKIRLVELMINQQMPEVYTKIYDFYMQDELLKEGIDPMKLTDEELVKIVKDKWEVPKGTKVPDRGLRGREYAASRFDKLYTMGQVLEEATAEEKDKILPYLAGWIKRDRDKPMAGHILNIGSEGLTPQQRLTWADALEQVSDGEKLRVKYDDEDKKETVDHKDAFSIARLHTWAHTTNHDVFMNGFAGSWAASGSGMPAQQLANKITLDFQQNQGKEFWKKPAKVGTYERPLRDDFQYDTERATSHMKQMYQNTQDFYSKKKDKELTIYRGVGGAVETYLPHAVESWTTDGRTATRFGKLMSKPVKGYTSYGRASRDSVYSTLTAKVTYADILFSYETMKNVPEWPVEKRLKGKKEFVPFGGALQDVKAEHFYE